MIWRSAVVGAILGLAACGVSPAASESPLPPTAPIDRVFVTRSIDGDTVEISTPTGTRSVRLIGIDSPESKKPGTPVECYALDAARFAQDVLANHIVKLVPDPTQDDIDRYGRLLRYIELEDGRDFSTMAAMQGTARSYIYDQRHPPQRIAEIQAAERRAAQAQRGIWSPQCLTRPTR